MPLIPIGPAVGGPFVTIDCPTGGDNPSADDIQRVAATALANDGILFAQVAALGPGLLAANNTWTGTNTYQNKLILSGNGSGIRKRWGDVSDADATLHTTNDVYLCAGATSTRTLTLAIATAPAPQDGEELSIICEGSLTAGYDVFNEGGGGALVTAVGAASTDGMATFIYRASTGRWYLLHAVNATVGTNAA
jgi:hypothetical protein